ncbi:MAG: WYL domain-containing protein [Gordonia sp. (in: high G+C Gram-positive bacteria)]
MSAAPTRFSRLLALIPYFQARSGISLEQAAADLGLTTKALIDDLQQLYVCGLPGYYGGDLIDVQYWGDQVTVVFTAGMDRPLRLTPTEASILLVALRLLVDTHRVAAAAATRAIAKIEQAVGSTVAGSGGVVVDEAPRHAEIRAALSAGRALSIDYYSASRDSVGTRIVDPIDLDVVDSHTYLRAWCRSGEGVRLFRFDRIDDARMLDEPAAPPPGATEQVTSPVMTENPDLPAALLEIDPAESWILDYYAVEALAPEAPASEAAAAADDAPIRARIVYGSPDWLTRFLLGFGGRVRVVGDDAAARAIRAGVADAARRARAQYS